MRNLKNSVQLIGNLGSDPKISETKNKKKMARMSIATTQTYKNADGEKIEETQWHNIVAWGNKADNAEKYLFKGSELALEGQLVTRSYEDADGVKKYYTEVIISDMVFLSKKAS